MNTATQLLERLKFLCTGSEDPDLYKDIEAYLAKQQVEQGHCVHEKSPEACYRVRCQLGKKCIDDDLSFRHTTQSPKQVESCKTDTKQSILIEGVPYTVPMPVACELLHLHIELKTLRLLYNQSQEEVLRLSLICKEKAREPMRYEDMDEIWNNYCDDHANVLSQNSTELIRAIEAHHGIK